MARGDHYDRIGGGQIDSRGKRLKGNGLFAVGWDINVRRNFAVGRANVRRQVGSDQEQNNPNRNSKGSRELSHTIQIRRFGFFRVQANARALIGRGGANDKWGLNPLKS
jgi:hypothetical protein